MHNTQNPPTEPRTDAEREQLAHLEADEAYWDYLDELEARHCGAREWDNPCFGGAR
jgi:hypothetical protein